MEEIKKVENEVVAKKDKLTEQLKNKTWQTATGVFNPVVYQQFKVMANDMARAGALPKGVNAEQALVIMQFGSELGIKPFTALQSIYIVNGRLTLWGSMVISRLTEDGWKVEYEDKVSNVDDENSCKVTVSKGNEKHEELYTFEMARKSGYTSASKPGWTAGTNRKLKLRYGAVSTLIKTKLPHLLNGAEIKEVWEDVTPTIIVNPDGSSEALDQESIDKISAAKDMKELQQVCKVLKEVSPDKANLILKQYGVKKLELES